MRLFCQRAFLLAVIVSLACHDVSGPLVFPTDFHLADISGRALPTFFSAIPEAPSIVSASIHLNRNGTALITEHQRDINQQDVSVSVTMDYSITGNRIEFQ